ncbi:MAG: alpha/beta hydrolase domain-containing protein [Alphaproteobacteria bacterium]
MKRSLLGFMALLMALVGVATTATAQIRQSIAQSNRGMTRIASQIAVDRLEVTERQPVAGGEYFGKVGAYEYVRGKIHFVVRADAPNNAKVLGLSLVATNKTGQIEFVADFSLLKPVELEKGNGVIFFDAPDKGNMNALQLFNNAPPSNRPINKADVGNGFLMRQGYSILSIGWSWDLLPSNNRLLTKLPRTDSKNQIVGPVVYEFMVDQPAKQVSFIPSGTLGYDLMQKNDPFARLMVRDGPYSKRVEIRRNFWSFDDAPGLISMEPYFEPGRIYEMQYLASDPFVAALGLVAVRDGVSFFRYERSDRQGNLNPLSSVKSIKPLTVIAFGQNHGARMLKQLLAESMLFDDAGNKVFDALYILGGGAGRTMLHTRFNLPERTPGQYLDTIYPGDSFPFATTTLPDPLSGGAGSLLLRTRVDKIVPLIFFVNSSSDYWSRGASLLHTDTGSTQDVKIDPESRIYHIAGSATEPGAHAADRKVFEQCPNPLDYRPVLRALLMRLDGWVNNAIHPPLSLIPSFSGQSLVASQQFLSVFPKIPDRLPPYNYVPTIQDFGNDFDNKGIMMRNPPEITRGKLATRVPITNNLGNEISGIVMPQIQVPLGSYTGWNMRMNAAGAADMISPIIGSFIPFAKTPQEKEQLKDPRPSLMELYGKRAAYEEKLKDAALNMQRSGFLLEEDVQPLIQREMILFDKIVAGQTRQSCQYIDP